MTYNPRKIRLLMALRGAGVTDTRVLAAIERIPREPHDIPLDAVVTEAGIRRFGREAV